MKFIQLLTFLILLPGFLLAQQQTETSNEESEARRSYIEGILHFENEEYEEALDKLTAAHLKLSDHGGVSFALADAYLALNDLTNASYYGQLAVDAEPENKWYQLKLAEIYRRAGRNEATIETFSEALKYNPDDLDILYEMAKVQVNYGNLLDANQIYNRILNLTGESFEIRLQKFRNFNALKMRDSALVELNEMRRINPGNLATLHTISQQYQELGDEESAKEVLLEAKERNARDPQTLLLLAELFVKNKEWVKLGDTFDSILKDPLIGPNQKLELVRFVYLQHQNQPDNEVLEEQTTRLLKAFSDEEPEFGPAQLITAEYYLQNEKPEAALDLLEKTNRLMPQESGAWQQRVQILFNLQRYDDIISIADSADTYSSDNAFVKFFIGTSHLISENHENAVKWLEEATMAPSRRNFRSIIYSTLGDALEGADRWKDASEAYETALRLDRNNHNAMNNYAYFMSVRDERLDYAEELAEKAINLEPDNASYLDTAGWIYYKMGDYEMAREFIQRSVDTGEASAEVYEHLGDTFDALNDTENAIKWWEKALEEDPNRDHLIERLN